MIKIIRLVLTYYLYFIFATFGFGQTILVISGSTFDFTNTSRLELSRLFLMQSDKIQGRYVVPINLDDEFLTMEFLKELTGKSEKKIKEHFLKMELRGEGTWPHVAVYEKQMVLDVLRVKKNLGWITEDYYINLPESQKEKLNIVMDINLMERSKSLDN